MPLEEREAIFLMVPHHQYEEARRFYEEGLDLPLQEEAGVDGVRSFLVGDRELKLVSVPGPLVETYTGLSFHVHRLSDFVRHLVQDGYLHRDFLSRIDETTSQLEICDPAGNRLLFLQETH